MANIPGVPTPSDPTCALSYCARVSAQVDCITYIMQGTTACIDIQLFNESGEPLNLDNVNSMQIQLVNELECVVANFWYPEIPSGSRGFDLQILQETLTDGTIVNEGLIRICLSADCTKTSPGNIFAEIILNIDANTITGSSGATGDVEVIGIPCFQVAIILPSKIYKNGGNSGCGDGFVTGVI